MKFLPTVIFFCYLKKIQASSELNISFELFFFFFYYLFIYSTAVVFFIRQVLCFYLILVLAIRIFSLKRPAVGSAKHLHNQ